MTPLRRFAPEGLPPPPAPSLNLIPAPPLNLSDKLRDQEVEPDPDVDILARRMPGHPIPDKPLDEPEISEEDRLCDCGRDPGERHASGCAVFNPQPFEEPNVASQIDR